MVCKPETRRCTGNTQVCQILAEREGSATKLLGFLENRPCFLSGAVPSNRDRTGNVCTHVQMHAHTCDMHGSPRALRGPSTPCSLALPTGLSLVYAVGTGEHGWSLQTTSATARKCTQGKTEVPTLSSERSPLSRDSGGGGYGLQGSSSPTPGASSQIPTLQMALGATAAVASVF